MDDTSGISLNYDWNGGSYQATLPVGNRKIRVEFRKERRKIKFWSFSARFYYYHITKWAYPSNLEAFTEEDRVRVVARLKDYFDSKKWKTIVDRSRICPHCHSIVADSNSEDWEGGVCDMCERKLDSFGNLVC